MEIRRPWASSRLWFSGRQTATKVGSTDAAIGAYVTTVQKAEDQAMEKVWPDLQEHVGYLSDVYTLAFKVQMPISGMRIADIPDVSRAQLMILMRITDYLRCIQLLTVKCYPEQAGTLA